MNIRVPRTTFTRAIMTWRGDVEHVTQEIPLKRLMSRQSRGHRHTRSRLNPRPAPEHYKAHVGVAIRVCSWWYYGARGAIGGRIRTLTKAWMRRIDAAPGSGPRRDAYVNNRPRLVVLASLNPQHGRFSGEERATITRQLLKDKNYKRTATVKLYSLLDKKKDERKN